MSITPASRLRAGVIAALAVAAFGASASSALANQSLSISDTTVQEGSHGVGGTATFTITGHYDYGETASYEYNVQTSSVSAGAGDDYVESTDAGQYTAPGPCDNPAGCTHESTFTVPVVGDDVAEDNEQFLAYLSSSVPVTTNTAYATILDDDQTSAGTTTPSGPSGPSGPPGPAAQPILTDPPAQGAGSTPTGSGTGTTTGGPASQLDDLAPDFSMEFLGVRKSVRVRVTCPADEISCSGRLFVRPDLKRNYGVLRFKLGRGESRTVSVPVSRSKRLKLRRSGSFFLRAVAYDAAGNRTVREAWEQI
ncbi:MAG TPA: hypothetical protein VGJ70_20550 [Solirubrobacteraceae bacterium]